MVSGNSVDKVGYPNLLGDAFLLLASDESVVPFDFIEISAMITESARRFVKGLCYDLVEVSKQITEFQEVGHAP